MIRSLGLLRAARPGVLRQAGVSRAMMSTGGGDPTVDELKASYEALLQGNRAWVAETNARDPEYFARLSKGQSPSTLWIGCADSRVPANIVTGTESGDIFVHRNIANTVVHTDFNLLSVLQYAVDHLEVKHIIVCGHEGCGGIRASMSKGNPGLVGNWLRHIKNTYRLHKSELDGIDDDEERVMRLTELHVMQGVLDIGRSTIVQDAWKRRPGKQFPQIHGWVYALHDGVIRDLGVSIKGIEDVPLIVGKYLD